MTLVLNEIHILNGLEETFILAAADRKLSFAEGAHRPGGDIGKKLFVVPYINGAVSYFGVAQVMSSSHLPYLDEWLPNFINRNSDIHAISGFAIALQTKLNRLVSPRN